MIAQAGHLELAHEPARRVEVEEVVVGELLALVLAHHREQVHAGADLLVVGGALVRVLAVGEVGDLLVGADEQRREVVVALGEPARDRRVVARGVRERVGGQRLARLHRQQTVARARSSSRTPSYASGFTTTAVNAWFFADARIIVGPPTSMFSMTSASVTPRRAAVRSNG